MESVWYTPSKVNDLGKAAGSLTFTMEHCETFWSIKTHGWNKNWINVMTTNKRLPCDIIGVLQKKDVTLHFKSFSLPFIGRHRTMTLTASAVISSCNQVDLQNWTTHPSFFIFNVNFWNVKKQCWSQFLDKTSFKNVAKVANLAQKQPEITMIFISSFWKRCRTNWV